jgi:phosphoribosylamine--glycine ligase
MKVLLIGGGGREHALAWKLRQSPCLEALYAAPGNAGILSIAEAAHVDPFDTSEVLTFCRSSKVDLVVVGPEAPLERGLADALRTSAIPVFGPSQAAARLETSKSFTKTICIEGGIATARFGHFSDRAAALLYARSQGAPLVVKADGLAAGKGVTVCETLDDAEGAIEACFSGAFGESGASVLIEEKLDGEEASFFALCDGVRAIPFGSAQDYKRAFDNDSGPNTGGMGAVSPAPMMTAELEHRVMETIIAPTLKAMEARGAPFQGVLYAGLMITADGPKLIEYNVRFGDPECQVLMARLGSDLLPLLLASANGTLGGAAVEWSPKKAMTVVMAAKGYPGPYETGSAIANLAEAGHDPNVTIFHAATARAPSGAIVASGGRVLNVTATGETVGEARRRTYGAIEKISWPDGFYRRDIGWRSLQREDNQ